MTGWKAGRFPGLDTLRAVAILAVMLYHLRPFLPESVSVVAQFGWMGVDLFFVLSGYLIGTQLLKPYAAGDRPSIGGFYRRRAYRILPTYVVVLWIYFAFPAWRESPTLPSLWQFLTFTVNLFFVDFSQHAFSHVWSLCVEEHFYLVLPLLIASLMRAPSLRKTALVILGVFLLGVCFRGYMLWPLLAPAAWSGRAVPEDFGTFYYRYLYYPNLLAARWLDGWGDAGVGARLSATLVVMARSPGPCGVPCGDRSCGRSLLDVSQ